MRLVGDAVGFLQLADVTDDLGNVLARNLRLRRHVAVEPMMLPDAGSGGQVEGFVRMMPRIVDVMDERRTQFRARRVLAVTGLAIHLEERCAFLSLLGQRSRLNLNCERRTVLSDIGQDRSRGYRPQRNHASDNEQ